MLYSKETNYDPTFGGLRKGVWIGMSGYKTSDGNVRWKWQDDFPVMFTRWGLNQPNLNDVNMEPSKSCVYIDKGWARSSDPRSSNFDLFKTEIGLSMPDVIFSNLLFARPILLLHQVVRGMIVVTMDRVRVNGRLVEAMELVIIV